MHQNNQEQKADAGKADWLLWPWNAARAILRVLEYGARRYSRGGWRKVDNAKERYSNAAMRHLVAYMEGFYWDLCPEHPIKEERPDGCLKCSGEPHLAHLGCDVLFLLELDPPSRKELAPTENEAHKPTWLCPGCGKKPDEGHWAHLRCLQGVEERLVQDWYSTYRKLSER